MFALNNFAFRIIAISVCWSGTLINSFHRNQVSFSKCFLPQPNYGQFDSEDAACDSLGIEQMRFNYDVENVPQNAAPSKKFRLVNLMISTIDANEIRKAMEERMARKCYDE
jgi:hypothetical protein